MFKIEAIQDIKSQEIYAKACGTVAKEGFFAYAMYDMQTGEPMGFAQFDIQDGVGYIIDLKEAVGKSDFEAMFILGRSTMNFIDLCGAHKAKIAKDAGDESLINAIGFKPDENGEFFCDMTGFFEGNCGNH